MRKPSTDELLTHHQIREPKRFIQLDGHSWADEAGDAITVGQTYELMHGSSVRVLIPDETDETEAVRLLREITHRIEHSGLDMHRLDYGTHAYSLALIKRELDKEEPDLGVLRNLVDIAKKGAPRVDGAPPPLFAPSSYGDDVPF